MIIYLEFFHCFTDLFNFSGIVLNCRDKNQDKALHCHLCFIFFCFCFFAPLVFPRIVIFLSCYLFFWFWFETCLIFRPVFANRTVHIIVRNLICSCIWYAYLLLYKSQVLFIGKETVFPYDWWFRGESVLRNFELTY